MTRMIPITKTALTYQGSVTDTAASAKQSYADKVKSLRFDFIDQANTDQANTLQLEQLDHSHVGNADDGFLPVEHKATRRAHARQSKQQEIQPASAPTQATSDSKSKKRKNKKKKKKKESVSDSFCSLLSPRG